jgi:hypothetical protein
MKQKVDKVSYLECELQAKNTPLLQDKKEGDVN